MDAFLKPSEQTDKEGMPLRLKTLDFLRGLHDRLTPEGLVVFNLNVTPETAQDLGAIRAAFPTAYVFPVPGTGNIVAGDR
jgi:spermidine synthase